MSETITLLKTLSLQKRSVGSQSNPGGDFMMKTVLLLGRIALVVFLSLSTAQAHSHQKELCNFMPKNSMNIPVGANFAGGGIDETTFNKVIDDVSDIYAPIIKKLGGKLKVNRLWEDGTVNASAQRMGKTYVLNMYGGLARHEIVTEDGFALVVCHELGHHLGGYPQKGHETGNPSWASNEGQSDYFATMKCFRKLHENDNNVISKKDVPVEVLNACQTSFKSKAEINLCIRGAMAGSVLANLLHSLSGGSASKTPAFDTPDQREVNQTNHNHPAAQCRLDTYFAGAACGISQDEDFGTEDPSTGACAEEKGDTFAYRPHCWYKPLN